MQRPVSDAVLRDVAKANKSKRDISLSLVERCLRVVVRDERFFVTDSRQVFLITNIPSMLQTLLLDELSKKVFNSLRYPASKYRETLVKLLINTRLQTFDFSVCGPKFKMSSNKGLWQCLAERASPSLWCVRDLRTEQLNRKANLATCLSFIAQLPKLQELQIKTLVCFKGFLPELVKVAPNLKILHLVLDDSVMEQDIEALFALNLLEEITFEAKAYKLQRFMLLLQNNMPQLKVNCIRADTFFNPTIAPPWHSRDEDETFPERESYNLEHYSGESHIGEDDILLREIFENKYPKVKHMFLTDAQDYYYYDGVEVYANRLRLAKDFTSRMDQLCTLYMKNLHYLTRVEPTLKLNGNNITTLILDYPSPDLYDDRIEVLGILIRCPNLTSLMVRGGTALNRIMDEPGFYMLASEVLLRKIHLIDFDMTSFNGYSYFIELLRSPLLEDLQLEGVWTRTAALQETAEGVVTGQQMTNLKRFKFTLPDATNAAEKLFVANACRLAKYVLAYCPKLEQAEVNLGSFRGRGFRPLLNSVNA